MNTHPLPSVPSVSGGMRGGRSNKPLRRATSEYAPPPQQSLYMYYTITNTYKRQLAVTSKFVMKLSFASSVVGGYFDRAYIYF